LWCHNPESKRPDVEIAFDPDECIVCGTCLETCGEGALSRENPFYVNRDICTLCFECVATCPSRALSRVGEPVSVEKILGAVLKDKVFFQNSGGGVTLSGGEPTLYAEFSGDLLARLKQAGIHTLLETCGLFDAETFEQFLSPHLDAIYFDIKLMDDEKHRHYCGASNKVVLNNFSRLFQRSQADNVEILPRTPLIPGITDTDENLKAIAGFLASVGAERAELLEYHPMWREKNVKLGLPMPMDEPADLVSFASREHLDRCRQIFLEAGIEV
jgi:pyruvate formate lyase activating enzyme